MTTIRRLQTQPVVSHKAIICIINTVMLLPITRQRTATYRLSQLQAFIDNVSSHINAFLFDTNKCVPCKQWFLQAVASGLEKPLLAG